MRINWSCSHTVDSTWLQVMQNVADASEIVCGLSSLLIGLQICGDEEIRVLNRNFRNLDRATDVLSFPLIQYGPGKMLPDHPEYLKSVYDDEEGLYCLGDVIISADHVRQQALEYGHPEEREAAYLLVHAICHLMGYDHMNETEKKKMRMMEEKILESVGMGQSGETSTITDETLMELARRAMEHSYSPYSRFRVGAALLSTDGRIFQGCNVENASLGITCCAERTALFKAVSEGARSFSAIAIASVGTAPWPCGVCRHALYEFAPDLRVIVTWDQQKAEMSLKELLPHGFGPDELARGQKGTDR